MPQSIIPGGDDRICFLCLEQRGIERHHVWFGGANRQLSEADGLTVNLCHAHHTGRFGVHTKNQAANLRLKKIGEAAWMIKNKKTANDFIKRYGMNALEWDEIERIESGKLSIEDYISEIIFGERYRRKR